MAVGCGKDVVLLVQLGIKYSYFFVKCLLLIGQTT